MVKQIIGGVFEELEKTAGNVVKQAGQAAKGIANDATSQVSGIPKSGDQNKGSSQWEQIVGKPMDPTKFQKMQDDKQVHEEKTKAAIRRNLQALMEPPPKKQQEPPKYIKVQVEKQQKMQEKMEEEKKKPPPLALRKAQGMASAETKGGWGVGG